MKKALSFFVLFISLSMNSFASEHTIETIDFEWNEPSHLEEAEPVYLESFSQAFKSIPREILKIPNLERFLFEEYIEEIKTLDESLHNQCWLAALDNDVLVGFASFDLSDFPEEIFIRKVFVLPSYQKIGVGKKLVFAILDKYPQTKKLVTMTRMINEKSILFWRGIGFTNCRYLRDGFFPSQHTSFVYVNNAF